jgi:chromatin assembly factor 1 subunit A
VISSLPLAGPSRRWRRTTNTNSRDSVRAILNELAEAEVAGDVSTTRSLSSLLEDRNVIPAKIFIFHEDTRPGYLGTWTRISSAIRPRRPLARDIVAIDYSYDSSEEWEEESPGDADDVADDNDDDDELDVGEDSDADSWLVDDDGNGGDDDDVGVVPTVDGGDVPPHSKRRLEETTCAGHSHKKRRVIPLIPFLKGPVWDPAIVNTVEEVFAPFRVRFFNGMLLVTLLQTWLSHRVLSRQPLSDRSIHIHLAPGDGNTGSHKSRIHRARHP